MIAAAYRSRGSRDRDASPVTIGRQLSKRADQGAIYCFERSINSETGWHRTYAFRNVEKWRRATDGAATKHWNATCGLKEDEKPKYKE